MGWVVNVTPRPSLTPGKTWYPFLQEAGWDPGPVWIGADNLATTGIRSPVLPARIESLYRLGYPARSHARNMYKLSSIDVTYLYLLTDRGSSQDYVKGLSLIVSIFTYFTPKLKLLLIPLKHNGNEFVSLSVKFKVLCILPTRFIHILQIILIKIIKYFSKHH